MSCLWERNEFGEVRGLSVMVWLVSPKIHMLKPQTKVHPDVTAFGEKVIKELIKSQWGHLGEPSSDMINILIRGNLGAHVHEQKEDHGEDTGGRWPFLGKPRTDRYIRRSQPDTFLSDIQRPELWGNILLFKSHLACGPLLSSPANLYNGEHITWDTSGNVSSNFSNQLSPLTSWGFALLTPREYLSCWPSCASKGKCLTVFMNTRRYSCNRE